MRQPLKQNRARSRDAQVGALPAPTGGWDAVSSIANMPNDRASILDNWVNRPGYLELRRGYQAQVTGTRRPVQTLMTYRGVSPNKLFAASSGQIFDVSTTGAQLPAPLFSGNASDAYDYINFSNPAGVFIRAVNGVDAPLLFDGATWSNTAQAITGSSGPITLDPSKLIAVTAYNARLFFLEGGSLRVWYLASEAIGGAASLLDLGSLFQEGGSLLCAGIWTIDGGNGPLAYIAFITTEGEVAVYQGVDPNSSSTWELVGVFQLGKPLGQRSLVRYGADLLVLTADGVVPLSQAARLDREASDTVAITSKIQNAFATAVRSYKSNFGWQGILYGGGEAPTQYQQPGGSLAIYNVPVSASMSWQFVQNIQTGAWSRFLGINATCWALCNEQIYFGASDGVYEWDIGTTDNGNPITYDLLTAFNSFGVNGLKDFTMVRSIMKSPYLLTPSIDVLVDYRQTAPSNVPTVSPDSGGLWGIGKWGEATWGDPNAIRSDWTGATGLGYVGAVRMRVIVGSSISDVLAVGDGDILATGDGFEIAIYDQGLVQAPVQLIGWNIMFRQGGLL